MFNFLTDKAFVESALEKGIIPFLLRGNLECDANFNFSPFVNIEVSGPTFHIEAHGENPNQENWLKIHIAELNDEAVFPGEIELPERTIQGISKALYGLELWADFLCLAIGNPNIKVEVQLPVNAIIVSRSKLDVSALDRWATLISTHFNLSDSDRKKIAGAIWWYRKGCRAAYYSVFDSYTAYWNCLEILCGVSGSKIMKGSEVDNKVQDYLKNKKKIKAGHILECYHRFVNLSIVQQMKESLTGMIGEDLARQVVYQCFEIKPEKVRLYQIRNDINHGNIRENIGQEQERVYLRGMLLWEIVMQLLYKLLGNPITLGMDFNTLAERLANPPWKEPS